MFDRGAADPHKHSGDFDGAYGKGNIMNEVGSPQLQASREAGLAHIMTAPHITIDGDEAAATNYTVLVVGKGDDCRVRRPSANRWDLVRIDGAWRIKRRTLRLIDGSNGSRELFRKVFEAQIAACYSGRARNVIRAGLWPMLCGARSALKPASASCSIIACSLYCVSPSVERSRA